MQSNRTKMDIGETVGPHNQVEQLQKEVEYWKNEYNQVEKECLKLYRQLNSQSQYGGAMEVKY